MGDRKSNRRGKLSAELTKRIAIGLSVRALWAVIVELLRSDA